jgi:putative glycosyltransferase (TIGR04372 family)
MKRFVSFIYRQITDIKQSGAPSLARKCRQGIGYVVAIIPVIFVRLARPFLLVRFGRLNSSRVGHFVTDAEFYLCEREIGIQNPKAIDFFGLSGEVCNGYLKIMCTRVLHIRKFVNYLCRVNRMIPGGNKNDIRIVTGERYFTRDVEGLLQKTMPHLFFTLEEERQGRLALAKMGLPPDVEFICFHARDSAYLKSSAPKWDYSYHNYRDCDVHNYLLAVQRLSMRGIYAFRMGAVVKDKLRESDPKIIDYANQGRTDFLDIYLSAHCRFFLGCGSGIDSVATVFRRPVAYANFVPLLFAPSWGPKDLLIPKKMWLTRENRFMSFRETLESGVGKLTSTQDYLERGIRVVENSAEEIADLAVEMDERLKGTWKTTKEDEVLQNRFWSFFKNSEYHGEILSHVGAVFLRQNRALLD